jgi:predicted restriction endonuclease
MSLLFSDSNLTHLQNTIVQKVKEITADSGVAGTTEGVTIQPPNMDDLFYYIVNIYQNYKMNNGSICFINLQNKTDVKAELAKLNSDINIVYPDDIESTEKFIEGKSKKVLVNVFERNTVARSLCIEHYGFKCQVCEFDFEKRFGEIGRNFIHVHHIVDISTIGSEYELDPILDLIPVCPNCHSMLHKKKPAYKIEELKSIINHY